MLQDVCVRTIGVLLLFINNAAGCLCQNDRCVVIVHRQCCRMFVSERYVSLFTHVVIAVQVLTLQERTISLSLSMPYSSLFMSYIYSLSQMTLTKLCDKTKIDTTYHTLSSTLNAI